MVEAYGLYVASVIGAIALYLMMPRQGFNPRAFGAVLGAAALGGLWLWLSDPLMERAAAMATTGAGGGTGLPDGALPYYYIFSGLAIVAAARVITHTQPVYSALWFVMVVLSSAGLFLLLDAEFVAFGMVIIYGGAILVTYVFVIMLASQSAELAGDEESDEADEDVNTSPVYDRVAREPAAAVVVGFLLLAMFLDVTFRQAPSPNPAARGVSNEVLVRGDDEQPAVLTDRPDRRLIEDLDEEDRAALEEVSVSEEAVTNVERVGVDLFRGHPLGLELAGVILLVALVGAVVIARQRGRLEEEGESGEV